MFIFSDRIRCQTKFLLLYISPPSPNVNWFQVWSRLGQLNMVSELNSLIWPHASSLICPLGTLVWVCHTWGLGTLYLSLLHMRRSLKWWFDIHTSPHDGSKRQKILYSSLATLEGVLVWNLTSMCFTPSYVVKSSHHPSNGNWFWVWFEPRNFRFNTWNFPKSTLSIK